ncbi:MAG: hypothetical protein PHY92_05070 [Alphaproteobacteria bacterium]|nr:hypothetical protein [Alphaproteobacteria bacterium]
MVVRKQDFAPDHESQAKPEPEGVQPEVREIIRRYQKERQYKHAHHDGPRMA